MRILAFDSATKRLTAALVEDGVPLARFDKTVERGHAENLLPAIAGVLKDAGVHIDDLDLVAVSVGPGSYTGIRIGLATAKGLVLGKNIPAVGVSTLEALAYPTLAGRTDDALIIPAFDARGGRLFAAAFDKNGRLTEDRQTEAALFARTLPAAADTPLILLGDGAPVLSAHLTVPHRVESGAFIEAPSVAALAARHFARTRSGDPADLKAFYAALTQAERLLHQKPQTSHI